jgi:hypothetical protein
MTYSELFDRVQRHENTNAISTKWIRDQVIAITSITAVKEQWTGVIDGTVIRGFYIEGPLGPPVPLDENEALIVLARSLDRDWRRIVYTKELMHAFDAPEEKSDTPEKFDVQIERFADPSADMSPQYRAEIKALWRALGVLCPEKLRMTFKEDIAAGKMSEAVVAASLRIPAQFVRILIRDDFADAIEKLK